MLALLPRKMFYYLRPGNGRLFAGVNKYRQRFDTFGKNVPSLETTRLLCLAGTLFSESHDVKRVMRFGVQDLNRAPFAFCQRGKFVFLQLVSSHVTNSSYMRSIIIKLLLERFCVFGLMKIRVLFKICCLVCC